MGSDAEFREDEAVDTTWIEDEIDEARLIGGATLNFDNLQLTEVPESVCYLPKLEWLDLDGNRLTELPESLGNLSKLQVLHLEYNRLTELPESMGSLTELVELNLEYNRLTELPSSLGYLSELVELNLRYNQLTELPESLGGLIQLEDLCLSGNQLTELPGSFGNLTRLKFLDLEHNPLNPELKAAYREGLHTVKRYLSAKAESQIELNEAKLILIGEGEVGKSCLLGALRGDPWEEDKLTTHGIEIKPVEVIDPDSGTEIKLNGWDFGGQRVYRPTHQLFFSAPAVYLVVWKPREGPQQGFVKEWIKLVKYREPEAKIIIVSTHGGPKKRQPDIDRQEIWDLFGKDTVVDFFKVESKPDEKAQERKGIAELKQSIARVAASLPEMGRLFPTHWQDVRDKLLKGTNAYLSLNQFYTLCEKHKIKNGDAKVLLRICHRIGDLIHYEHDKILRDIVVLKPDWLATAISFVLDDEQTRVDGHGLVSFTRLNFLWNDPERLEENRYPANLHPIFLRLMERFDLSYRVTYEGQSEKDGTSLIAQLVPDTRPALNPVWYTKSVTGDEQQIQVCRIVDTSKKESASAEGLFYQLIVRLHKYSLGRAEHNKSVHWQRGLVLEDDTGARAFLQHVGNDVHITVRSPYPERFLSALTYEVKWLVESFWKGMRCEVTVPCLSKLIDGRSCIGLFEVSKLIENKRRNRPEQPCPVCNEWHSIEQLLHNSPAAQPNPMGELTRHFEKTIKMLNDVRQQLSTQQTKVIGRFDQIDARSRELVSKVEGGYDCLMRMLVDEAKEGPRLFSFVPVDPDFLDRPEWMNEKFRITLWCEHCRLPLPMLNGINSKKGVYDLTLPRKWLVKSAPFLKFLTMSLSLIVPMSSSATKLILDDGAYNEIKDQLSFGQKALDSVLKGGVRVGEWFGKSNAPDLEHGELVEMEGGALRELQKWLKDEDPSFGGMVRVLNKQQEFQWVHSQFEEEY